MSNETNLNAARDSTAEMSRILDAVEPIGTIKRRGLLLILSSPSGAGKTTLSRMLCSADPALQMSVSATTRPARPGETEGKDYHFVSHSKFDAMVEEGAMLEHARVFDNLYGTPRAPVEDALAAGRDVLFDVDWQGAQQIRTAMAADVVSVFVLPPSVSALEDRLRKRAQDDEETVRGRMAKAIAEIEHWHEYGHVLVNDDLSKCAVQLASILAAERLRLARRREGLNQFVGCISTL